MKVQGGMTVKYGWGGSTSWGSCTPASEVVKWHRWVGIVTVPNYELCSWKKKGRGVPCLFGLVALCFFSCWVSLGTVLHALFRAAYTETVQAGQSIITMLLLNLDQKRNSQYIKFISFHRPLTCFDHKGEVTDYFWTCVIIHCPAVNNITCLP